MHRALSLIRHSRELPNPAAPALIIGAVVVTTSLALWHGVLATGQGVAEDQRFLAFGLFVAGLFTFAFLLGGLRTRR